MAMIGMQSARFPGCTTDARRLAGARAAIRSSMRRSSSLLDPVEEARDQLLVVGRPELLARGERRLQLLLEGRFGHPGILATEARRASQAAQ